MKTIAEDLAASCGHYVEYTATPGAGAITFVVSTNNSILNAFSALLVLALAFLSY